VWAHSKLGRGYTYHELLMGLVLTIAVGVTAPSTPRVRILSYPCIPGPHHAMAMSCLLTLGPHCTARAVLSSRVLAMPVVHLAQQLLGHCLSTLLWLCVLSWLGRAAKLGLGCCGEPTVAVRCCCLEKVRNCRYWDIP